MDRRDFIKNTSLLLAGSCLACSGKLIYDYNIENTLPDGSRLKKEYLIEKYKSKNDLPKRLRVDACTLCQLKCPGCYRIQEPENFKNSCGYGYLSFKNFKKLVDENKIEIIELANAGEIFLNPELEDIIKYASEKYILLDAGSGVNMNYLTDSMAKTLVDYGFGHLTVSIDGASQETYKQYRVGGDFNQVIENIKKINYYKKKFNSMYPVLDYKFIVFGHNEHEIDKAKELAEKLNMVMKFDDNAHPEISPIKNVKLVEEKTGLRNLKHYTQNQLAKYKNGQTQWFYCNQLWESPQINWDGKVLGCCANLWSCGGNVFKEGLLKALNNPKIIYAKNMLLHDAPPMKGIICSDCDKYKLVKSTGLKLNPQI